MSDLAREFAGKRVLDYGCGDRTFLALTAVDECRLRYRDEPRLQFAEIADRGTVDYLRAFAAVFCMEVLEHVVEWEPVFDRFQRLPTPAGELVVSVPVETGLPLIVRPIVRRIAGWRGVGYYPGSVPYSMRELARAVAAGSTQHMTRPAFDHGDGPFHHHKVSTGWCSRRVSTSASFRSGCSRARLSGWVLTSPPRPGLWPGSARRSGRAPTREPVREP